MRLKLLWADDQPDLVASFSAVLPPEYALTCCIDGVEALQRLTTETFDVVILDLSMPPGQWGGLWLLEQMKAASIKSPVIIVSGEGSQTETIKALRLGASDYVVKTQMSSELRERVENVVASAAASEIAGGESAVVEFKASARWDRKLNIVAKHVEQSAVKTVAGFLNSVEGGRLYIGVDDNANIVGILLDLASLGSRQDVDAYENWLMTTIITRIGKEVIPFISMSFREIEHQPVCQITVRPASRPVFVTEAGKEQFFARAGNSTRELSGREMLEYCKIRWPHD